MPERLSAISACVGGYAAEVQRAQLHADRERAPDLPMRQKSVGDEEGVCPTGIGAEWPCGQRARDGGDGSKQYPGERQY